MNIFKELLRQWLADTPALAKWIRNVAGTLTAALPAAWYFLEETGVSTPAWFEQSIGYMIFISAVITLAAGTKEKKKTNEEN